MGSKSDTPPTPDYQGLAQQQFGFNEQLLGEQTQANRPNQTTPWGSTNWTKGPDGSWSEFQSLNPQEQATLAAQQKQQGQSVDAASHLFNTSNFGTGFSGAPDVKSGNYYNSDARNAVWDQFQSMQNPLMDQQMSGQISQLEAQGLRPGDPAYDAAIGNLRSSQGNTRNQAMDQAVLAGSQVGQTNQGMDIAARNSWDTQRQNQYNMFNSLMGGTQNNLSMPGFTGAGSTTGPDLTGAANNSYGAALNATNAQNAAAGQTAQGAASLGTMALMFAMM